MREGSLLLRIANAPYNLPIHAVNEVLPLESLRKTSWAPPWFRGVVPSRSGRVPVLDLAVMLRLGSNGPEAEPSCVVVADMDVRGKSVLVGLLADDETRVVPRHAAGGTVTLDPGKLLSDEDMRAAEWLGQR